MAVYSISVRKRICGLVCFLKKGESWLSHWVNYILDSIAVDEGYDVIWYSQSPWSSLHKWAESLYECWQLSHTPRLLADCARLYQKYKLVSLFDNILTGGLVSAFMSTDVWVSGVCFYLTAPETHTVYSLCASSVCSSSNTQTSSAVTSSLWVKAKLSGVQLALGDDTANDTAWSRYDSDTLNNDAMRYDFSIYNDTIQLIVINHSD